MAKSSSRFPILQRNGCALSNATIREARFPATLTAIFATPSLVEDFLRIKTYGLVAGEGSFDMIFNEFETTAVSEPSTAIAVLLIGAFVVGRRQRMFPR